VVEPRRVEICSEPMKLLQVSKDEAATRNVIHSRELHSWKPLKLVGNGVFALVALGDDDVFATETATQDGLECVEHSTVGRTPLLDDAKVVG